MPFLEWKKSLSQQLAQFVANPSVTAERLSGEFTFPPNIQQGHLALPCFRLAKDLGKQNHELAQMFANQFKGDSVTAKAAGPYANFRFSCDLFYTSTLETIFQKADSYGRDDAGNGQKKVVLEYCSPNIAKRLAFQHIRSTLIGNTLANVYQYLGYPTERINFVGDWGAQFARLVAAVELWGDRTRLKGSNNEAMDHLFELYVKFHKEAESDPKLIEHANGCLKRLEERDKGVLALWSEIKALSLGSMQKTLDRMQVRFDLVEGESLYVQDLDNTLNDIKKRAHAVISDGAWIVQVEGIETPALIQKRDGTTLYLTRDLAAAMDRKKRLQFDQMFYVVSEQQKLHFQLLFGVLKKMGESWADRCKHLSFGTVLFGEEKMSTREGRVIFLDALLDEARARALVECTKKNPDLKNKDDVAEAVGVGAVVFGELSAHIARDIEFNWEHILALEGDTGPYVQYSLVRCHSLLAKATEQGLPLDRIEPADSYAFSAEEETLLIELAKFRFTLHSVVNQNEPYLLTHYLIDVAKAFNRFYYRHPVLQAGDAAARNIRLGMVRATRQVLSNGLSLLGIRCPQEM